MYGKVRESNDEGLRKRAPFYTFLMSAIISMTAAMTTSPSSGGAQETDVFSDDSGVDVKSGGGGGQAVNPTCCCPEESLAGGKRNKRKSSEPKKRKDVLLMKRFRWDSDEEEDMRPDSGIELGTNGIDPSEQPSKSPESSKVDSGIELESSSKEYELESSKPMRKGRGSSKTTVRPGCGTELELPNDYGLCRGIELESSSSSKPSRRGRNSSSKPPRLDRVIESSGSSKGYVGLYGGIKLESCQPDGVNDSGSSKDYTQYSGIESESLKEYRLCRVIELESSSKRGKTSSNVNESESSKDYRLYAESSKPSRRGKTSSKPTDNGIESPAVYSGQYGTIKLETSRSAIDLDSSSSQYIESESLKNYERSSSDPAAAESDFSIRFEPESSSSKGRNRSNRRPSEGAESSESPRRGRGGGGGGKGMTKQKRKEANARERTRIHTIGAAFESLRQAVPAYAHNQKLSKLAVLRIASAYILALACMAEGGPAPSLADCVDRCTRTVQAEGRSRRRSTKE